MHNWSAASGFKTNRASGMVYSVGPHLEAREPARARVGYPDLVQTVEADSRAQPAFELDVDSPGATRICALLVRGTVTSGSLGTTLQ